MAGLYHIGLTVSDLERSMAFYRDAVGMELEYRSEVASKAFDELIAIDGIHIQFCYLTLGGFRLQLIEYVRGGSDTPLALGHNKVGNPHISLWVDDIDGHYARLRAMGTNITSEILSQESADICARTFYFTDPDGIQVEFCEKVWDHASAPTLN